MDQIAAYGRGRDGRPYQKLIARYDPEGPSWSLDDVDTGLSVRRIRLHVLGADGVDVPLRSVPPADLLDGAALEGSAGMTAFVDAIGLETQIRVSWVVAGGVARLNAFVTGPTGRTIDVFCEADVRFPTPTVACRLTARPSGETILQAASGDPDNALANAVFCRVADAALEIDGPALRIDRGPAVEGDGPTRVIRTSARLGVRETCRLLSLSLREKVYGTIAPSYRPAERVSEHTVPAGWMSYYCLFEEPSEAKVLSILEFVKQHLVPFGMEYFSVEMWQSNLLWEQRDGKLVPVDRHYWGVDQVKFPKGMKWLAAQIREAGLKPGIWAIPFGIHDEVYYTLHREMFLHDATGKPFENWSGVYLLDPTRSDAQELMARYVGLMTREWGYSFLKLDGLSGGDHYSERFFRRPDVLASFTHPTTAPYRDCLLAMRKAMGPQTYFLACAGEADGVVTGIADGARVVGDPIGSGDNPTWDTVLYSVASSSKMYHLHGYLWHNDPDIIMQRDPLTTEEGIAWASTVALTGQVLFSSDILPDIPLDRVRALQRVVPVIDALPTQLYPVELKEVYDLKIRRDWDQWDVVGVFNWAKERVGALLERRVSFAELGCDPEGACLVWDFWGDRYLGRHVGGFDVEIAPRTCGVYCVRRARDVPQLLTVDRHISQGGVCLRDVVWDAVDGRLSGVSELVGGHLTTVTLHVPEPWSAVEAGADNGVVVELTTAVAGIARLRLRSERGGAFRWWLDSTKRAAGRGR
jgi:hypothetical protein